MPSGSDDEYLAYVHARQSALRRTALMLSGDLHQADDIVQETLTKLYARWSRVARADNVDAYVHTILVRVFLDDRRRGWWKVQLVGAPPDPEPAAGGSSEDREVVRAALWRLAPRQQAVLVLRYLCDQSVHEVARILGCSDGTVKSQTSHGLNRLRGDAGDRLRRHRDRHRAARRLRPGAAPGAGGDGDRRGDARRARQALLHDGGAAHRRRQRRPW